MMLQGCGKDSSTTVDHQTNDSGEKSQPPTGPVDWKDWVEDRSHKLQRPPEQDDNFRELQRRMLIQVLMTWEEEGLVPEGDNPNAYREVSEWDPLFLARIILILGPLVRYLKLRVAHAPGIPGTFSPPQTLNETVS